MTQELVEKIRSAGPNEVFCVSKFTQATKYLEEYPKKCMSEAIPGWWLPALPLASHGSPMMLVPWDRKKPWHAVLAGSLLRSTDV